MITTTRILLVALLALLALSAFQHVRISSLKATAAKIESVHAQALSQALQDQSAALSAQTIVERKAKEDRERRVAALLVQIKQLGDYNEKLADSLRVFINGMLTNTAEAGGVVSPGPRRPPGTVRPTGRTTSARVEQF